MRRMQVIAYTVLILGINGCSDRYNRIAADDQYLLNLQGYKSSRPDILHLPPIFDEVSGIIFYEKDSSMIMINDDEGILYQFPIYDKTSVKKWPFSKRQDFEEIVKVDSFYYAMQSNGNITKFKFSEKGLSTTTVINPTGIKFREFESMVYDSTRKVMLLTCKDCEDDSSGTSSVFAVDFENGRMYTRPVFTIDKREIEQLLGADISKFKPSSAAIHPLTGDFYYISAINDIMVVTDNAGKVKEACVIDKKLFKQPEGISFTAKGDMIISNEYADRGTATLLFYKYNKQELTSK